MWNKHRENKAGRGNPGGRDQQISQGKKTKGAKFKQERKDASAGPAVAYKYLEGNQLQKERKDYSLSAQM